MLPLFYDMHCMRAFCKSYFCMPRTALIVMVPISIHDFLLACAPSRCLSINNCNHINSRCRAATNSRVTWLEVRKRSSGAVMLRCTCSDRCTCRAT